MLCKKSKINQTLCKQFFKRQITLTEFGEAGQKKLQNTSVLVVGCGGLGGTVAVYLANSGIGKLHLIDFDTVDESNLHRQVFYALDDIGKPKAEILAKFIKARAPHTDTSYTNSPLVKSNAKDIINQFDLILDATDSLPTKYLLNDVSVILGKPLVYGSLYKFDGYVSSFNIKDDQGSFSSNLRDAFPVMKTDVPNCEEAGTLNAIVGMIATAQVNEVLKIAAGIGEPLVNQVLIYNALKNSHFKLKLSNSFTKDRIENIFETETYFDISCVAQKEEWQIAPEELKKRISDSNLELIAVLPNLKLPFQVHQTISIQRFDPNNLSFDTKKTYVFVCQKGLNSYKATQLVRENFPEVKALNLTGGIESY